MTIFRDICKCSIIPSFAWLPLSHFCVMNLHWFGSKKKEKRKRRIKEARKEEEKAVQKLRGHEKMF